MICKPTPFISRRIKLEGHVSSMKDRRGAYSVVVGKSEVKSPLGRPRNRWYDNIEMDLQDVGCGHGLDISGSEKVQVL